MEEKKAGEPSVVIPPKGTKAKKVEKPVILKNVLGKEVDQTDYFFSIEEGKGKAPIGFNKSCGNPVEREELIEVFNKVFKPQDNILFYKAADREVYIVIVPLKYSSNVSLENGSVDGDFQKHAISFIGEGSVNIDTLRQKLNRIVPFVKYGDR